MFVLNWVGVRRPRRHTSTQTSLECPPPDLVIAPLWGLRIVLCHVVFCFQSSLLAEVSLRERPLLAGNIIIFLEFHSNKQGLPLVDSWSRGLD